MNRRAFAGLAGGAVLAAALAPRATRAAEPADARARALYRRALVLDCNSAPPFEGDQPLTPADLEMVRSSGIDVLKLSLGGINSDLAATVAEIGQVAMLIERYPETFMAVRSAADLKRSQQERRLGIILSFESADMLGGRLDSFSVFRALGVRVMQLSYNRRSPFAAGVMEPDGGGLTVLGRDAVREMNRLGIAIDVSHANAATTSDVLALSQRPVVMTHAGCAAVHAHPRNKSDEQLRALAAKGGVVGIYDLPYLTASPRQPQLADYMQHLEHALEVAGSEHVGIGSDVGIEPFDTSAKGMAEFQQQEAVRIASGLAAPEEDRPTYVEGLNTPHRLEIIAGELLKRGYSERVTEGVLGGNFARVFTEIWSA
jgi:membrane dipeptidase